MGWNICWPRPYYVVCCRWARVSHNLAYGVLAGVLLAALFFANKVGHYWTLARS